MERAVLPWVLLYAGLCPAPFIFLFDLQSAYKETAFGLWGFVFIRNRRCSLVVSFGFFHEEYLIALVDFIVALRRTKGRGRRTLRSPPSPSSGLHLIHPGYPLRRGILAAAVYTNLGSGIPVQVDNRQFRIWFGCFVFGLVSFAFQSGCPACIVRFSLLGGDRSCLRLRDVLPWKCVELPLTATVVPISLGASPFHQLGWVEPYWKNAFVRFELLMIWYSIPFSTKTNDPTAVSANPTKDHSKTPT